MATYFCAVKQITVAIKNKDILGNKTHKKLGFSWFCSTSTGGTAVLWARPQPKR